MTCNNAEQSDVTKLNTKYTTIYFHHIDSTVDFFYYNASDLQMTKKMTYGYKVTNTVTK